MDGAEHVASAIGDVDPVTVFDVVSRLVDKNLVVTDERPGGEQHYRLLETLRAYAIERARAAGELGALRDAQVTFWLDWLERHEPDRAHRRRDRARRAVPRQRGGGTRVEHPRPSGRTSAVAAPGSRHGTRAVVRKLRWRRSTGC